VCEKFLQVKQVKVYFSQTNKKRGLSGVTGNFHSLSNMKPMNPVLRIPATSASIQHIFSNFTLI
jgi:hypothetical protein